MVSLPWWDDLWLKESLADFIAHFCLEKIRHQLKSTKFDSAMIWFRRRKVWGYNDDQMDATTHPIRGQVKNTSIAYSRFDGITYAKGAACIRQLVFLVGEEKFGECLGRYFQKYKWKNAALSDFISELS